ncbi:MAG: transposase [SAR324 cluster bacterium]|nr:transposase [SAR324 cluster bacterium]
MLRLTPVCQALWAYPKPTRSTGGFFSVFLIRSSRAASVAQEILGLAFKGILVSDRYSAYTWVDAMKRQLCWAHLIRDILKISQRGGADEKIGADLLWQIKRMFQWWHRLRKGNISGTRK